MRTPLIIGTRGSDLALWQARHVQTLLEEIGLASELKIIKTQGDEVQNLSFDKLEGKGFFTKEIEEALIQGITDIAVHSHKDLPTESVPGLLIVAVSEREDPSELLLILKDKVDPKRKFQLRKNALVGTSSNRRKAQFLAFRPDVEIKDLRGNVPTRIGKLRDSTRSTAANGIELRLTALPLAPCKETRRPFRSTKVLPAPRPRKLALELPLLLRSLEPS